MNNIKDAIVTCLNCKQKKKTSEIMLPKGYNPTFIDGYYRCIACWEVDELYNHLARERDELKEQLAIKDKALELACEFKKQECPYTKQECTYSEDGKCIEKMGMTCWRDYFIDQAKEKI